VYVLLGLLAAQIAFGDSGEKADQSGALQKVADQPFGKALLWLVVIGFAGYALWRATEAVVGHTEERSTGKRIAKRVIEGVKAVIYAGLALLAARIAMGDGGSGNSGESTTAKLLKEPGGRTLVIVVGLVLVGVGIYFAVKAFKASFEDDLELSRLSASGRRNVVRLGRAGYLARAIVTSIIGALVVTAALRFDPEKAQGLDLALRKLAEQPFGRWLLLAVALGLACFGVYSLVEARIRRL
jgi:chorismate-pyruvate lyase